MVTFAQSPPNSHLQQTLPTSKITLRAPISPPYETPPDKSPPDDHRTTTRRSFCSHYRTNPLKIFDFIKCSSPRSFLDFNFWFRAVNWGVIQITKMECLKVVYFGF
uniref:Uncharacterized protein n=1 Tax=Helianthus annuus TaxID=4232 RepID=A0A251RTK3_HELAN